MLKHPPRWSETCLEESNVQTLTNEHDKIKAVLAMVKAVADAIRELDQVPSGELYARVMGTLGLDEYEWAVCQLIRAGLVTRDRSHMLRWIAVENGGAA